MDKPIVFFSHSTKDEKPLRRLKEIIDLKTGLSISIFLTSDGQSIPFGRNWVHKIEEALSSTSLMFVFISPNSIQSNWIYFESGYAYSKGIKVVPVGVQGVDLTKINPPLSLLQGFNIDKSDALGNIVATINETYNTKFDETFDTEHFSYVFEQGQTTKDSMFLSVFKAVLKINDSLTFFSFLRDQLLKQNLESVQSGTNLYSNGLIVHKNDETTVRFSVDGSVSHIYLPIIRDLLSVSGTELHSAQVFLDSKYRLEYDFLRQTALLKGTTISIAENQRLSYEKIEFGLEARVSVRDNTILSGPVSIKLGNQMVTHEWLTNLCRILVDTGVVH